MPEKTKVKMAIITAGVSTAQAIPTTHPLQRPNSSLFANEKISSARDGSCQSGCQILRCAVDCIRYFSRKGAKRYRVSKGLSLRLRAFAGEIPFLANYFYCANR